MRVLVTGGAGFIGSAVVRQMVGLGDLVINVDALTYAGSLRNVASVMPEDNHVFVQADICDAPAMAGLFERYQPDAVVHLAAETHVDRSIGGPAEFIRTNVTGTGVLLEAARVYWSALPAGRRDDFRFLHVSTDEVYGSLGATGLFNEDSPYRPSSPYSASKAAADHMARAWHHTYGLPVMVSNCTNNYGPHQFPEKLIPFMIQSALAGRTLPVYGGGENVRDWLYVEDHAEALRLVLLRGQPGRTYAIGGRCERRNIDVVRGLCALLDELSPRPDGGSYAERIAHVTDRPGHDLRYAVDIARIEKEIGWTPSTNFEQGLRATVEWYLGDAVLRGPAVLEGALP